MQFQFFFDYYAIINSCSFTRKYDAISQALDKVYDGRNHPAFILRSPGLTVLSKLSPENGSSDSL
jgi:hypothetical protein